METGSGQKVCSKFLSAKVLEWLSAYNGCWRGQQVSVVRGILKYCQTRANIYYYFISRLPQLCERPQTFWFFPSSLCKLADKGSVVTALSLHRLEKSFVKEEAKGSCWLVPLKLPWLLAHTERGYGISRLSGHRWATPWKNRASFWLSGIKERGWLFWEQHLQLPMWRTVLCLQINNK